VGACASAARDLAGCRQRARRADRLVLHACACRFKDAVLRRSLAAGAFVSRPFTRMMAHHVTAEVAGALGTF
jgi:hypothetical protein